MDSFTMECNFHKNIFTAFAYDTFNYVLRKKGHLSEIEYEDEGTTRTFDPRIGDYIFDYRESRKEIYSQMRKDFPGEIFKDDATLIRYTKLAYTEIIRGDVLLMDILRYFAFYADLAILCFTSGYEETILFLVDNMDYFYKKDVFAAFLIVGSYRSLARLAEQFLECKNFKFQDVHTTKLVEGKDGSKRVEPEIAMKQSITTDLVSDILKTMKVPPRSSFVNSSVDETVQTKIFDLPDNIRHENKIDTSSISESDALKAMENLQIANISKNVFVQCWNNMTMDFDVGQWDNVMSSQVIKRAKSEDV